MGLQQSETSSALHHASDYTELEEFDLEVYGRAPRKTPRVKWEVTRGTEGMSGDMPVVTKPLVGHYGALGNLVGIHGDRPENEVFAEIQQAVDQARVAL